MQTFTWVPEFGGQKSTTPTVQQVKFGDGYEQRFPIGINTQPRNFSLSFVNRQLAERTALISFLEARNGVEAFLWTPPGESSAIVVVCRNWNEQFVNGSYYTIQLSLEQVFEP